ncbi:MAG: DUF4331 family protein [Chloroflexota bacterium]
MSRPPAAISRWRSRPTEGSRRRASPRRAGSSTRCPPDRRSAAESSSARRSNASGTTVPDGCRDPFSWTTHTVLGEVRGTRHSTRGDDCFVYLIQGRRRRRCPAHPGDIRLGCRLRFTRTGSKNGDMLRVNVGIKPNSAGACVFGVAGGGTPSRLGALDGDLAGFPNGRRLLDDVTDIELRAILEGYGPTLNAVLGVPNRTPNNLIGDGVDANDTAFLTSFPYIGTPHQGYDHMHDHSNK